MKFSTKALLAIHLMDTHDFKEEDAAVFLGAARKVVKNFSADEAFKFQCDVCLATLQTEKSLKRHKIKLHEKHTHAFKCDQCDFTTSENAQLKTHIMRKHEKATKYPCDQCSYVTNIQSSLKFHVKRKHEKKFDHSCNVCGKEFISLKCKAQHMLFKHEIIFKYQKRNTGQSGKT